MTWDEVVELACRLPGVEVSTSYGTPALKVRRKFMARLRQEDPEPDVMVLGAVDDIEQRMLMDTRPSVYFKRPHYKGHPSILIRLPNAEPGEVGALLEQSWRRLAPPRLLALLGGGA
ncbi:MAG TPA: MmcQ/YjbR family DNA-binding protein [Dehalococcoidia bacterium]|nr:MmcQ/YjbR family DNA-binding protein [Dehalococcoidia bacterium]